MGSVRARKGSGKLFVDFRYRGQRCREQTALDDTPANRKKLAKLMARIEAEVTLGIFDYRRYFPESRLAEQFEQPAPVVEAEKSDTPVFEAFAETWYEEMKVGWRESYQSSIRGILDKRLLDHFGDKAVAQITKADLLQFRAELGKVVRKDGKRLSATHINRHMKILRMILNEAADRYEFTSPYHGIKPLKVQKTDIDPFTLDEITQVLGAVRPDFHDYYTVRFFTGMRTGEIDGLKWRYVDFSRRQILVRETVYRGKQEYTKNAGSQREIDMSQPVYQALQRQKEATSDFEYVFCTRAGTPLSHNNVTKRVWYPLLRHVGLRKRRPYQTRHTAATLWLASGENPEWIARQMGHANTEMLFRVYSRYVPNLTRKDGSAFENLLASNMATGREAHHG
jgi:integrase